MDLLPLSDAAAGARQEIRSLRANVTQQEALAALERRGGLLRGRLRQMASAYLPFRLYHVEVRNRGATKVALYGADAVTGHLDLYEFGDRFAIPGYRNIVSEVVDAVGRWPEFAEEAGVDGDRIDRITSDLSQARLR